MRGVDLGNHGTDCTFETILRRYGPDDPVRWRIAVMQHKLVDEKRWIRPRGPASGALAARYQREHNGLLRQYLPMGGSLTGELD